MLPRKKRLIPSNTKGTTYHTPFFSLRVSISQDIETKYGFVISKKVAKQAVVRNKIKRRLSTCIMENEDLVKNGYHLLFFCKKEAVLASKQKICQAVTNIFISGKLFK